MICPRCKNQDPKYFYTFNNTSYCRKCIHIGLKNETISNTVKKVNLNADFKLDYQLTPLQEKLSNELLNRYKKHQNTILKAVCGAGKTEITYALIKYALNSGHNVCFTTPRKELVIELAKRFESQFTNVTITCVYGGHTTKTDGQFIICTTHQLYRYPNFFDLLILDEIIASSCIIIIILYLSLFGLEFTVNKILSAILAFITMYVIKLIGDHLFKRESMGGGDIKLMFLFGLVIGYPLSICNIFLATFIAFPIAIYLLLSRKDNLIPFGPFLAMAAILIHISKIDINSVIDFILK